MNLLAYFHQCQGIGIAAQSDSSSTFVGKICASKLAEGETIHATNRLFVCNCTTIDPPSLSSSSSSGSSNIAFKEITCTKRKLDIKYFDDYTLPDSVAVLSMGWNNFAIPKFSGDGLTTLDMSHNNITAIGFDNTFANVTNLIELDLSWNRIATLAGGAFHQLGKLKRLDLSHNQLSRLPAQYLATPSVLEVLILSNNARLGEQSDLNVGSTLRRLEVNEINLHQLNLESAEGLTELFARYNQFNESVDFAATWPRRLELIDLSGSQFERIPSNFLVKFSELRELFLQRMPNLKRVEANAFANLSDLIVLDFEGSKELVEFNERAFGDGGDKHFSNPQFLERLILRGGKIERLGSELTHSFHHLKRFDLYGNPLNCDCDLRWVSKLNLETNGRCNQPDDLNGTLIGNIRPRHFTCLQFPNFVYVFLHAVLVMSLFAIFTIPVWLIVLLLRSRRHREGRKIGATSPYARITIESNRAEDMYSLG